jgi:hypothetical protein
MFLIVCMNPSRAMNILQDLSTSDAGCSDLHYRNRLGLRQFCLYELALWTILNIEDQATPAALLGSSPTINIFAISTLTPNPVIGSATGHRIIAQVHDFSKTRIFALTQLLFTFGSNSPHDLLFLDGCSIQY